MLTVERDGAVLNLTLNRPEVRNAFNAELIKALTEAFGNLQSGDRVVVIRGAGEAFCAGGDLHWMREAAEYTFDQNAADARRLYDLFEAIATCPALVVSHVHGACFGGGCGIVAASDVVVADAATKFAFSEVRLGLVPATISPFVLPKIGAGHARALFATGAIFDAERALRIGLVHEIGDAESIAKIVKNQLAVGPLAAASSKRLAMHPPLDRAAAADLLAETRAGDEAREGIGAFLEKRKASFAA